MKKYTGNNKGGPTVENIINMLTINWLMVDEKPLNSTRPLYQVNARMFIVLFCKLNSCFAASAN